nr:D-Ala-D-Ala carboxypeptidase family metallohydrolase [Mesorhizobium sp. NBSH29]
MRPRYASGQGHAILGALAAMLLASCSTSDPSMEMTSPAFNMAGAAVAPNYSTAENPAGSQAASADGALPTQVAYLPTTNPSATSFAIAQEAPVAATAADMPATEVAAAPQMPAPAEQEAANPVPEAATAVATLPAQATEVGPVVAVVPTPALRSTEIDVAGVDVADVEEPQIVATAPAIAPTAPVNAKKKTFLSSLFGKANAAPARPEQPQAFKQILTNPTTAPAVAPKARPAEPLVQLASLSSADTKPLVNRTASADALPGVRQNALFEIKRKSGLDDDSDVDVHEDEVGGPVRLASAAGLARLAPNGLRTQTGEVDVACLKPSLVRELKVIEQHYGRKVMVTSGYRNPSHNRRARGAKNSLHMYCAAADIQIDGISKWELATYIRSMPGRGGVGTYCHTDSVHIDVGPERDWNWRCRRRQ